MIWVPVGEVGADEDVLHTPGEDPSWSEHHYFFFADRATGFAGGCRVAWRRQEAASRGIVFAFTDDGVCLWQHESGEGPLSAGPLSMKGLPLGEWGVVFDSDVLLLDDPLALSGLAADVTETKTTSLSLDLRFVPVSPAVSAEPGIEAAALVRRIAPNRFEQVGRYDGVARLGSRIFEIEGFGTRDHSWGTRDAAGLSEWAWCTLPLREGSCGGASFVRLEDGEIHSGWLAGDSGLVEIEGAEVSYEFDATGMIPRAVDVTIGPRQFRGTIVTPLGLRVVEHGREVLAVESLTRYVADDGTEGLGIAEYVRAL